MQPQEVKDRLLHLERLGENSGLVVHGFLIGRENTIIHDFAAGRVEINPAINEADDEDVDYRLRYFSWDGRREVDVTDLSDEQFISFMKSEPPGLVEYK